MMELMPRRRTELLSVVQDRCSNYSGAVPLGGRRVIHGSEVFRVGRRDTGAVYYEGRPVNNAACDHAPGTVAWICRSTNEPTRFQSVWNRAAGFWKIQFNGFPETGLEITLSYSWQPHYLYGAEIMVRLNDEERFVPIADVQAAFHHYLADE